MIVSYTTINIQWTFHCLPSSLYCHIQTPHREGWVYVNPALWLVSIIYICDSDWVKPLSIGTVLRIRKKWAGKGSGGQKKTKTIRPGVHLEYSKPTVTDSNGEWNRDKLRSDRSKKSTDCEHRENTYWRITFSDVICQFRLIFGVIFPTGLMKLFRRLYMLSFIQPSTCLSLKRLLVLTTYLSSSGKALWGW